MASLFKTPTSTPLRSPGIENLFHPDNMNPDEQQHDSLSSPLCQRCKSIDLQGFFSGASAGTNRIFHRFMPPHHLQPSECSLCYAVAFIRPDVSENNVYHLVQVQTDLDSKSTGNRLTVWRPGRRSKAEIWTPHTRLRVTEIRGFDVVEINKPSLPGGLSLISDLHPCENLTLNLPRMIDFDVVKAWMDECKEYHDQECELESGMSNIPNLRLIDCDTRRIRPHQNGDVYAALSYCWGASPESQADGTSTPFQLPQNLPATIEDAILATQKLGIKCIWIDRYCIPQGAEDPGRYEQISLMHKIYRGAEVTLIAAAGDSPTYGLPGVTKERKKPPMINFGSNTLVATLPDPRILISSSKWSTRGWTYQEGLLSRRRLVFTDQQVYFQCNKTSPDASSMTEDRTYFGRSEAVSLSSAKIKSCNISEDINGLFEFVLDPHRIWPRINEYTQRSLSRQEDTMNAMLGIFEKYAETKWEPFTFWHIFGIPIFDADGLEDEGISWRSIFLFSLAWELLTPSKRREGFPSWSWAGWEGTGFLGLQDCYAPVVHHDKGHYAALHVERDDGMASAGTDPIIQKEPNTAMHWKISHIIFECQSVPLHIKHWSQCAPYEERPSPLRNYLFLLVAMQSGEILHCYDFELLPRDLAEDPRVDEGITCVGLLLGPRMNHGRSPEEVVVLLVMESHRRTGTEKTGRLYERIGKTLIPYEHLEGISDKREFFTVG